MLKELFLLKHLSACIILVAILTGSFIYLDVQSHIVRLFDWLDELGGWAPTIFIIFDVLVVVFLVPGFILTLGAGFLFGVLKGTLYVIVATTIGAAIAFLIARHFFGDGISNYLLSHPKLKLINDEFTPEGWKIVLLTRLVPFFPFKLSNYFFGLTKFSLRHFVLGTFFGIMPITLTNVYLGSLAADLATLSEHTLPRSPIGWTLYGIGFIVTIIGLVYITRLAHKALDKHISKDDL